LFRSILAGTLLFVAQMLCTCATANTNRQDYVGDQTCRTCHAEKFESYSKTAHHLTSRLPSKESILGSFAEGKNILQTANPALSFRMDSGSDGFYETSLLASPTATNARSEKIDVVIGSGRVGQTYLYWKGDQLFQLPVSYWVDLDSWINSPGYRDGALNFERLVQPRCLECHTTYADVIGSPVTSNRYKRDSLTLGISCERCHGPGRKHVESAAAKESLMIVNPSKLNRDRQMDVCAQCHGGRRIPLSNPFSYIPGEPLDKFYQRDQSNPTPTVDVHGNQVALLQTSKCYKSSADLTCSTCHDVHQAQRDAEAFSEHCLKCHRAEACRDLSKHKEATTNHCVQCHMPVQASNLIITNSYGKKTQAMVRSHWIKVYEESRTP
jgi:hypothetical protein